MNMKTIHFYFQFQIGLMFTITDYYKGQREFILSIPFVDICVTQLEKKYR